MPKNRWYHTVGHISICDEYANICHIWMCDEYANICHIWICDLRFRA